MLVQPCSNRRDSHIGMNKFIIDQTNNLCFVFCDLQFSIYQFIAIWSKPDGTLASASSTFM